MATIQVRDIPDDVHAEYRARAAAAGMSLQEYLRTELIAAAQTRTPAEIILEVAAERQIRGDIGYSETSSASFIRVDRDSR